MFVLVCFGFGRLETADGVAGIVEDEVVLSYAGSTQTAQIVDIDTRRGGQVYLYTLLVRF